MEEIQLRSKCKNLVDKLKCSQRMLSEQIRPTSPTLFMSAADNLNYESGNNTNEIPSMRPIFCDTKSTNARSKLSCLSKASVGKRSDDSIDVHPDKETKDDSRFHKIMKGSESVAETLSTVSQSTFRNIRDLSEIDYNSSNLNMDEFKSFSDYEDSKEATTKSWYPATPNTIRKRQLIDRHTNVPSNLDPKELKELNNERLLNFNYCHINIDDDVKKVKTTLSSHKGDKENLDSCSTDTIFENVEKGSKNPTPILKESSISSHKSFTDQLQDDGNNRNFSRWLKETTVKPKSLLNSTGYYSLNPSSKNSSRVRFESSGGDNPVLDQHLLGYDWIAALLDNDPNLVNQSESFFDEIRDFRKAFKNECSNHFYMETPYTLVDTEPEPVVDALTEPKVRPYVVNERLFTEPLKTGIIDYDETEIGSKSKRCEKGPTEVNPRFVRVSIPRSTLQTPYRVKPHRRGSFDGSDSCALMDHCLLGWENTRPAMIPSAETLDLNTEAGTRIDSETTTLAEAERLATEHNRVQWPFSKPNARLQTLPTWRKHYMNTTLNMTLPPSSHSNVNNSTSGDRSCLNRGDIKRVTDRILSQTYSTMYEMERLRQERDLEEKRGGGGGGQCLDVN